jgi:hypothetical protein
MALFVLLIALAGIMAVVFFGLSVLVISVVGWLWALNDFSDVGGIAARRFLSEQAGMPGIAQTKFDVEELCQHLKTMPETELLRFGQVVKYMCSPKENCESPGEAFIVQLREARAEWRRRHPQLPLIDSI